MDRYHVLLEFLQGELGDALEVVVAYDEAEYEVLYVSETARELLDDATKSVDDIHEDAILESMKSALDDENYGGETFCKVHLGDRGTTCLLVLGETDGVLFAVDPGTDLTVPAFVERCLDRVEA